MYLFPVTWPLNNPQLSNITVLHTIKLIKQLNTSYVSGCTCLKKIKIKKIIELELGEREKGKVSSLHELQGKRGLPPTENQKLTIQQVTGLSPISFWLWLLHLWLGLHMMCISGQGITGSSSGREMVWRCHSPNFRAAKKPSQEQTQAAAKYVMQD